MRLWSREGPGRRSGSWVTVRLLSPEGGREKVRAAVLRRVAPAEERPLSLEDLPVPFPGEGEVLLRISVCGICRTELDEVEGRVKARLPVIPGHQVVGRVEELSLIHI